MPAEIRNRIYDFTLDLQSGQIDHDDYCDWDRLYLSRACRQIFAETASPYFTAKILPLHEHGIRLDARQVTWPIVKALTPSQNSAVTKVTYRTRSTMRLATRVLPFLRLLDKIHTFVFEAPAGGQVRTWQTLLRQRARKPQLSVEVAEKLWVED
jgi:hypothetical protein